MNKEIKQKELSEREWKIVPKSGKQTGNYLGTVMEATEGKASYDNRAKQILSNVHILARILKYTVAEFGDCDYDTIIECIDAESKQVASVPVHGGKPKETVQTLSQESYGMDEGKITFDIRFEANSIIGDNVSIIDVEAQKKYYIGYNIITRGFAYTARMLSEQVNSITTENYDLLPNVYSIWICMNVPKYLQNTITKYNIQRTNLCGEVDAEFREDLMCVVTVCLGNDSESGTELHQMLSTVLSDTLSASEKKRLLKNKFHIPVMRELEEDVEVMCNLSDLIEEKGIAKGLERGIDIGIEQGIEQGSERMLQLISKMSEAGEVHLLPRLSKDKEFLREMLAKYHCDEM